MDSVEVPKQKAVMAIAIEFDVATGRLSLFGCDENPVVALGMLDYALARVRRFIVQSEIAQEIQNAPRIQVVPRVVS